MIELIIIGIVAVCCCVAVCVTVYQLSKLSQDKKLESYKQNNEYKLDRARLELGYPVADKRDSDESGGDDFNNILSSLIPLLTSLKSGDAGATASNGSTNLISKVLENPALLQAGLKMFSKK